MKSNDLIDRFLNSRSSILYNQTPSQMKKYVVDSLELIEKIQLLEIELKKAKDDLISVCGEYVK